MSLNIPSKRIVSVNILLIVSFFLLYTQYFSLKRELLKEKTEGSAWTYDNPSHLVHPHDRFKAAFITFVKNDTESLTQLRYTVRKIEDQFNKDRGYPYIVFTNQDLPMKYMELVGALSKATIRFEKVGSDLYGYRPDTDLEKAAEARKSMSIYPFGDSEDYRFQSRFMAGTIYKHPLIRELDMTWRFEAGTEYTCPIEEDLFQYIFEHNKTTSFSMALYEYKETVPSLYQTILDFADNHPQWVQPKHNSNSLWKFVQDPVFNGCHFWNNFQISRVNFFTGKKYQTFFDHLDALNGIFYERWGDPVIQSLGATLFLSKSDIHFWDSVGYRVAEKFTHCPSNFGQCTCRPEQNFDGDGYSCLRFYF
ncbi:nucleotide-diphospho-sugar transferase [Sporodiniella umbellata]|nr:nucleotide-diphospho-sugar transferase [Sporodiniella umbellata]